MKIIVSTPFINTKEIINQWQENPLIKFLLMSLLYHKVINWSSHLNHTGLATGLKDYVISNKFNDPLPLQFITFTSLQ